MAIGGPDTSNLIVGDGDWMGDYMNIVINESETISGTGTIGGGLDGVWGPFYGSLQFTNDSVIETNNDTSSQGGVLHIVGGLSGGGGDGGLNPNSFTNNGLVEADNGGTLIFGVGGYNSLIGNTGMITVDGSSETTKMEIAGNVTFSSSSSGFLVFNAISLGGSNPEDDEIVSDGKAASLTLANQTLMGAGLVGDSYLTLNNESGSVIDATNPGQMLSLDTGSHTITNQGTLEADSGELGIGSTVGNTGAISALDGGSVFALAPITGSGAVNIGQNSILDTDTTIARNVTFTGTGAQLILDNGYANGGIGGQVVGAQSGDSIDFEAVSYSPAVQALWNQTGGTLSLVNGSSTLATLNLAGSYTSTDFSVSNDYGTAQVKVS